MYVVSDCYGRIYKEGTEEATCRAGIEKQAKEQTCGPSGARRGWDGLRE